MRDGKNNPINVLCVFFAERLKNCLLKIQQICFKPAVWSICKTMVGIFGFVGKEGVYAN